MGSAHRLAAPYQAVRCADGHIIIAAANDRLFERLCTVLGHPEWVADPTFATNSARVAHLAALMARIEAVTMQRSCATWLETLTAHDVPCGPIRNYADVFADPQVQARGLVVEVDHPVLGRLRTLGPPMKLSGTPMRAGLAAPRLGEHTRVVLRESGLVDAEVEALLACGAASAAQDVAR
jgi:formyl-CoA transferase